ncbi:MAG: hypothetical protein HY690_09440 [Chloroflexi bacterium]|nr:hypothetical protein [Chloroflexota bacterium]
MEEFRQPPLAEPIGRAMTRRQLLHLGGLVVGLASVPSLLAACSAPAATPTAAPTAVSPKPTAPPPPPKPTAAPTTAAAPKPAAAAGSISVVAKEEGKAFLFDVDNLAVPAGKVKFSFKNAGKQTHEVMVYPMQDLSEMLNLRRQGKDVEEMEYIKGMAGKAEDIDAGKSASFDANLKPGFYELACHVEGKNPNGSTYLHFDKGQSITIAAFGSGGPAPSILTPASTMNVKMVPGEAPLASSWLFYPDRLVVKAGEVTFSVTNNMKEEHDFVVYPLGDISEFIKMRLQGGEHGEYDSIKGNELIEDLSPGKTLQKTFKLTPGLWVAACFMSSKNQDGSTFIHRDRGQRFTFLAK